MGPRPSLLPETIKSLLDHTPSCFFLVSTHWAQTTALWPALSRLCGCALAMVGMVDKTVPLGYSQPSWGLDQHWASRSHRLRVGSSGGPAGQWWDGGWESGAPDRGQWCLPRRVGLRDAGRGRLGGGVDGNHVWCTGVLDRVGADGRPGGAQDGPMPGLGEGHPGEGHRGGAGWDKWNS